MRRRVTIFGLLLLPVAVAVFLLFLYPSDWPPPVLIMSHGLPPSGGPTGRTFVNSLGMEMIEIEPGYFRAGSCKSCHDESFEQVRRCLPEDWEHPSEEVFRPWVEVSRGFWIARTEVTIAQYLEFDPDRERFASRDDEPVVDISFEQATGFCEWLSARERGTYRLPMESEWEFACRSGSASEYCFGDDVSRLPRYAWVDENSRGRAHPVASLEANAWGLFDMHGNAAEWCETFCPYLYPWIEWDGDAYTAAERERIMERWTKEAKREFRDDLKKYTAIESSLAYCLPRSRGGSWNHPAHNARSADKTYMFYPGCVRGFRVVWMDR